MWECMHYMAHIAELAKQRCRYKAPEVANEVCMHCDVCGAKKIMGYIR